MSGASLTVMPILATPLGVATVPEAEPLNAELRALFAQRAAADTGAARNPLCYVSRDDLMEWPDAPVGRLKQSLIGAVYSLVANISELSEAQLRALRLEGRAWFTVIRANGALPAANFPMTAWCAIYCVAAPPPPESRPDSGVVRLYESRLSTAFQDATTAALHIPFSSAHYTWRPAAGQMIIFPAALNHEVALLKSSDDLILVTARMRFIGADQQGYGRW